MKYEIRNKKDFMSGSYLYVSVPDEDVDYCALRTIQSDCPDFILPLSFKSVNNLVEFAYNTGTLNKLLYFSGDFSTREYIKLWSSLLKPLIECRDWLMTPRSFVLDFENLYFDKHSNEVRYLYIPTTCECSNAATFSAMGLEVSKHITVSDAGLENKILRAIMSGFTPTDTLKVLQDYPVESCEIQIDAPLSQVSDNLVMLPDAMEEDAVHDSTPAFLPKLKAKVKRSKKAESTQSTPIINNNTGLKYTGTADFPVEIKVSIGQGSMFTIGRYDATVGKQQSSFEFDRKTKAVSRRHAVIERDSSGYKIIDLSSSAGTFVNAQKLPPNTPCELLTGNRVSFGNLGADYVWEVS